MWNSALPGRRIERRLLLRIHSDTAIDYVQDLDVSGVTEHTLYSANQTATQTHAIVEQVAKACVSAGLKSADAVFSRLRGKPGRALLRAARWFETQNGTAMTPSLFYVDEVLAAEFDLMTCKTAGLCAPIGYHSAFGPARVNAYTNLKAVI